MVTTSASDTPTDADFDFTYGYRPDAELTHEQILERNLHVVDAHFHNENPAAVETAVALYGEEVSWEAPSRGIVMNNRDDILTSYRGIFETVQIRRTIGLRRFATEQYVFDDSIGEGVVVGDAMQNLPFAPPADVSCRLVHLFEMKDGKIVREIAYEIWREQGSPQAVDFIPEDAVVINFDAD